MSITIAETSFDQLIQKIQAPPRSRSGSVQSYDGVEQSPLHTHARQDFSPAELRRASTAGSQSGFGASSNKQQPGNVGTNNTSSSNTSWRGPRSRSGSVASSASSGKLAYTGILRHAVQRPLAAAAATRPDEAVGDRPFPMARRVTGAQARAGCILSSQSEVRPSLQGLTPSGLPVWWCQYDNLVVFDGMLKDGETGDWIPMTRSSKGLPISNARGEEESVVLDLQCEHCKIVLGLQVWRYSTKVCRRGVCTGCKVRCRQEYFRMMKQGHSFHHFEKVASTDKPQAPVLERVPSTEITDTVLAPLLEVIAKTEASTDAPAQDIVAPVSMKTPDVTLVPPPARAVSDPPAEVLEAPNALPVPVDRNSAGQAHTGISESIPAKGELTPHPEKPEKEAAHGSDERSRNDASSDAVAVGAQEQKSTSDVVASTKTRSAPSISGLYFENDEEAQNSVAPETNAVSPGTGIAVELSPTHSTGQDIRVAITIDGEKTRTPERNSLSHDELPQRGSVSGLTIMLPEDCHADVQDTQADSPQSEHPETPTFEFSEPGPIIEDILSPKFPQSNDVQEEEAFDISLVIRNLDTDEVTAMPVVH